MTQTRERFDRIIFGAGIFGLYAALICARKGYQVAIVEKERAVFTQASYINQARIHGGYHYPRSIATAEKTAHYVERFVRDFGFAINRDFEQYYAIAKQFSYTDPEAFELFCKRAGLPCESVPVKTYCNPATVAALYKTKEYGFDAATMKQFLLRELDRMDKVSWYFNSSLTTVNKTDDNFTLTLTTPEDQVVLESGYVVNATYAGLNEVIEQFAETPLSLKYEFAEVALCTVSNQLDRVGLTVMDGPFCSLMPFGFSRLHTLTSVSYTPHEAATSAFALSQKHPESRFAEMEQTLRKFMGEHYEVSYQRSLYTNKVILAQAELDDARPTCINVHTERPYLVSILSGKLNTIFDLDDIL